MSMSAHDAPTKKLPKGATSQRLERLACERSLHFFTRRAWKVVEPGVEFVDGDHIRATAMHLEAVTHGRTRRLIINFPPRHMKSLLVCVFWFCWTWIHQPWSRWLFTSYASALVTRDSRKCREILNSEWYQGHWGAKVQLKGDVRNQSRLENTEQGVRIATTVRGTGTGLGGDYIVADDPNKLTDRFSATDRQVVHDWWETVVSSRGNDPKTVRRVVVQQRVHENDLSGKLMKQGDKWDRIVLPARYEENHPTARPTSLGWSDWRTEHGELLWPERFGDAELTELEEETGGSYNVASQLQQRPSPQSGGVVERDKFRYYRIDTEGDGDDWLEYFEILDAEGIVDRVLADNCLWYQTVDTATKEKQHNDWTVVGTFALSNNPVRLFVVDIYRARLAVPKQFGMLLAQYGRWPRVQFQAIEDKSSGTGLIQEGVQKGLPIRVLNPGTKDKVARAVAIATMYENGTVFHRAADQAGWLEALETELVTFPTADHDDQVDALAYAGILAQQIARAWVQKKGMMAWWPGKDGVQTVENPTRRESLAKRLTGREAPRRR